MKMSELPGNLANPGFIFVPELIELRDLTEPVCIGEFARLHRVNSVHKDQLRALLEPYIGMRRLNGINPWEYAEVTLPEGGIKFVPISNHEEQQYWVLTNWRKLRDTPLHLALELADPSITPVLGLSNPGVTQSGYVNRHAIFNWLDDKFLAERKTISPDDVKEIENALDLLIKFEQNQDPDFSFIHKALQDFADIKSVARRKPLYVVGLFSIIESLLTTDQAGVTGKSLNHQLREKISLMSHRFQAPLMLSDFFGKSTTLQLGTVVKKLYEYRSDVAHGNGSDFGKDLAALVNHDSVCKFLHALVRRLILRAIQEPDLIRDLKRC
jgi:hypothetical protein